MPSPDGTWAGLGLLPPLCELSTDGLDLNLEKGFSNVSALGRRVSRKDGRSAVVARSSPPSSHGAGVFFLTFGPRVLIRRASLASLS